MGKIEIILRIIFVSVFVLHAVDLIVEKDKKALGYKYYYEEYQKVHAQSLMPFIRVNLNLNSTQYDTTFNCITNLPNAPKCMGCCIQTIGAILLICSFFIIIQAKFFAFLSYIILSIWIIFYSLIICNPYTVGDEKLAFQAKQKLYTNFLLYAITLCLAFTPNALPKNPKVANKEPVNENNKNTKTKSKKN